MTDLAWTGETAQERFTLSAREYQEVLNRNLFNNIYRDLSPNGVAEMGISGSIDITNLPSFNYERRTITETISSLALDIVLMILFTILLFVLVYVSFLRYDVR